MRHLLLALLLGSLLGGQSSTSYSWQSTDLDRDGIPDGLEQMLLERFLPTFHVSRGDCDVAPSRFAEGEPNPTPVGRDGTIYGQALPVTRKSGQVGIELHYYHLWAKDCGRLSHALDVEYVAALVEPNWAEPASDLASAVSRESQPWEWAAVYWFAAGHQSTVCDVSHATRAPTLIAEHRGPEVWIATGKHASYLSQERCKFGCGGDTCPNMAPVKVNRIVNVGEMEAPMNGAVWTASPRWPFRAKMISQFSEANVQRIESSKPGSMIAANEALPPVRATILAGGETLDGVATGSKHTGEALKTGKKSTGNAVGVAAESTGKAILKSLRAVKQTLGGEEKSAGSQTATATSASQENP